MKRRDAVKGIILFSLGTGILYSCADKYKAIKDLNLNHFEPKDSELDLIEQLSNMIVPFQSIPELANHTALPLMFIMLDDVYKPEERVFFTDAYQSFDEIVEASEQKNFSQMNQDEQNSFLSRLNVHEEGIDQRLIGFYDIIKNESLRYLKTSEYYQRKVNYYEMAPGRFKGDVLISELRNANEV